MFADDQDYQELRVISFLNFSWYTITISHSHTTTLPLCYSTFLNTQFEGVKYLLLWILARRNETFDFVGKPLNGRRNVNDTHFPLSNDLFDTYV